MMKRISFNFLHDFVYTSIFIIPILFIILTFNQKETVYFDFFNSNLCLIIGLGFFISFVFSASPMLAIWYVPDNFCIKDNKLFVNNIEIKINSIEQVDTKEIKARYVTKYFVIHLNELPENLRYKEYKRFVALNKFNFLRNPFKKNNNFTDELKKLLLKSDRFKELDIYDKRNKSYKKRFEKI